MRLRRRIALAPIVALGVLFYYWTGTTDGKPIRFGMQRDYYNRLTTAFLHGHLSLNTRPPAGLLALKDPYNPRQNFFWHTTYYDLVLYRGHFFLTWGPTPILTLLMPWRLLQVGDMPVNLGVIIYCSVGLLCAVGLLCVLVDRYLPKTKTWQLALSAVALTLCNIAPFLLRRPSVYELAVSSGYCFAMLGALLIASGGLGPRLRPWRLGFGSLCVGLAAGGRPALAFEGLVLVGLFCLLLHRDRAIGWARRVRLGGLLMGPFVVVMILLLSYNYARFGSFLQYGIKYCLCGEDQSKLPTLSTAYLTPGLWAYIVAPVRWTFAFPFFTLPPPPAYPGHLPSYYYSEISGGLLTTTPILVVLIPAIPLLWRRRLRELSAVILTFVLIGGLALVLTAFWWFQFTMRYEMDFASFFLIPALLAWLALLHLYRRKLIAVVGAILIVYGAVVGLAISMYGYYDLLRQTDPGTYSALERITSPIPTVASMIEGHPVVSRVIEPAFCYKSIGLATVICGSLGNSGTYDTGTSLFQLSNALPVEIDVISPDTGRWSLRPTLTRAPTARHGPVEITISSHGVVQHRSFTTSAEGLVLPLRQGLNKITIDATAKGAKLFHPLIWVYGVSFAKHITAVGSRVASP